MYFEEHWTGTPKAREADTDRAAKGIANEICVLERAGNGLRPLQQTESDCKALSISATQREVFTETDSFIME